MSPQNSVTSSFEAFIKQDGFPCVGAKIALNKNQIETFDFGGIRSTESDQEILDELSNFIATFNQDKRIYFSFVCTFKSSSLEGEAEFDEAMWAKLQRLHNLDSNRFPWDKRVSSDPSNKEFSFSLGGQAFFIIGLNPHANRKARRFKFPAIVFNLHNQFQTLKNENKFNALRDRIRSDEEVFSGSPNPNLHDHGIESEARQYSGRTVNKQWRCPFSKRSENE